MADCSPILPPPTNNCYPVEHPCTVWARLENALVQRAISGGMTGFRVGEESHQFSHISVSDLRALRDEKLAECKASGGCPPGIAPRRKRASVCFVHSDHTCRNCGRSSCGCSK